MPGRSIKMSAVPPVAGRESLVNGSVETEIGMDQIKIGRFIAEMRKKLGFTQRDIAEKLGISDKTVSKWECGKGLPDHTLMLPLCKILQIDVNELLAGEVLPKTDYNAKSEENVQNLLLQTEEVRKQEKKNNVVSLIGEALLAIFLMWIMQMVGSADSNNFLNFIDLPTLLMIMGIVFLVLVTAKSVHPFLQAFRIAFSRKYPAKESETALALMAVKLAYNAAFVAGGICFVIGTVATLGDLGEPERIGVNLAVSILSVFYSFCIMLLLLPVRNRLELLQKSG